MDRFVVIEHTRRWICSIVIGLNLCPFARRVFESDQIRYVVTESADEQALLADLTRELEMLAAAPIDAVETTLLIHPLVLDDFFDYNDFLDVAEKRIDDLRLTGVVQIASFHPHYQFAGAVADAPENFSNRSPYPMLHLLREESISRVADNPDELREIPRRNVATLRNLGKKKLLDWLKAIQDDLPSA